MDQRTGLLIHGLSDVQLLCWLGVYKKGLFFDFIKYLFARIDECVLSDKFFDYVFDPFFFGCEQISVAEKRCDKFGVLSRFGHKDVDGIYGDPELFGDFFDLFEIHQHSVYYFKFFLLCASCTLRLPTWAWYVFFETLQLRLVIQLLKVAFVDLDTQSIYLALHFLQLSLSNFIRSISNLAPLHFS